MKTRIADEEMLTYITIFIFLFLVTSFLSIHNGNTSKQICMCFLHLGILDFSLPIKRNNIKTKNGKSARKIILDFGRFKNKNNAINYYSCFWLFWLGQIWPIIGARRLSYSFIFYSYKETSFFFPFNSTLLFLVFTLSL